MKKKGIIAIVVIGIVGVVVFILSLLSEDGSFLEGLFSGGGDGDVDLELDDGGSGVKGSVDAANVADLALEAGEVASGNRGRGHGSHFAADMATVAMLSGTEEENKKGNRRFDSLRKIFKKEQS